MNDNVEDHKEITWDEYAYRHQHIWSNLYKLTFAVSLLSVLPYLHREVVCVIGVYALWAPALAMILSAFAICRGYRELKALKEIRTIYREKQKTSGSLGKGWFTSHMLFYLVALLIVSSVNAYVVYKIWIKAVSKETNELCFVADTATPDKQLKDNNARIDLLESKLANLGITISNAEKKKALSSAQQVSGEVVQLAKTVAQLARTIEKSQKSLVYDSTGFIWVGNYNISAMKWQKILLVRLDGQLERMAPNDIEEGTKYTVAQSIELRDGLPPNNKEYFRARKKLDLICNGTKIQIISSPEPIDREFAIQYWAKIKVLE